MSNLSHDLQRKAFSLAIDQTLCHVNKDREKGLLQILDLAQKFMEIILPRNPMKAQRK